MIEGRQRREAEDQRWTMFAVCKGMTGKPKRAQDLYKFDWETEVKGVYAPSKAHLTKRMRSMDETAKKLGLIKT